MKKTTREWLVSMSEISLDESKAGPWWAAKVRDILDSDARQRAEIRDLRAKLKLAKDLLQAIEAAQGEVKS